MQQGSVCQESPLTKIKTQIVRIILGISIGVELALVLVLFLSLIRKNPERAKAMFKRFAGTSHELPTCDTAAFHMQPG